MIFDQIFGYTMLIISLLLLGGQTLLEKYGSLFEYKTICKIKTIIRTALLITFTVINFFFGLVGLHSLDLMFILFGLNVILLLYFFYDFLYLQQRTKEYIYKLQKENIKKSDVLDLLICKETTNKYEYQKTPDNKRFHIIKVDDLDCIYYPTSKGGKLFYPKETCSTDELEHICEQLNLEKYDEMHLFKNKELYEFDDLYVEHYGSKIYFFIKKIMSNRNNRIIATAILCLIGIAYCIFILMYFTFEWTFLDWVVTK